MPDAPRHITPIPYPASTSAYQADRAGHASQVGTEHVQSLLHHGTVPLPPVPADLMPQHVVCVVVDQLNAIVDAFNVIIADLDELAPLAPILSGLPSVRLEVLTRAFWTEAYRGKAIVFKSAGELRRQGLVDRAFIVTLRQAFEQALEPMYDVRHSLQHGDAELGGTPLHRLRAVEALVGRKRIDLKGADSFFLLRASNEAYRDKADAVFELASMFREVFGLIVIGFARAVGLSEPIPDSGVHPTTTL